MKTKFKLSNRILSLVLAFVMALGMMPMTRFTALAATEITPAEPTLTTDKHDINGDDTMDAVYEITTAAELFWFAEYVNAGNASACAKLMNDITVNENVIVNGALNSDTGDLVAWTPIGVRIGSSTKAFSGTFDGGNHTISGLYVSVASGYQGLIGFMESGTVKNVTVANSYFSGTTNIGAVVGCYGQTGTASIVTNCHNVNSVVIASDYYVGGIVGGQYAPATSHAQIVISDCSNSGSVTGAQHYVGGIIGYAEYFSEGAAISNCTNTGTVTNTSTSRSQGTGGIAGYFGGSSAVKVEIVGCTNYGTIQITEGGKQDYMGGIIGRNSYGHISGCNNTGTISGYQFVGGIVGTNSGTVTNCRNTGTVIATGSAIGGIAGTNSGTVTGCTNSADVQGQWYVGGINGSGIGTGLSDCTNTGDVTSNTYGAGGVIGYVDAAGTVENCHNEGDVKGTYYIGGLVGSHYSGKVNYAECSNKGNVEGSSYDIGGLFGRITGSSVVTRCYNTGNVTCTGTYSTSWDYGVGGLAGATFNAAMFENCYNTGAVNGGSNANIGGLVGFFTYASGSTEHYIKNSHNTGSVTGGKNTGGLFGSYESINVSENCYNTGVVTGGQNIGGLVGYHKSTGSGIGVIKNCYNIGSVSGTSYVGGLFGYSFYNNCLETSYNVGTVSGTSSIGGVIGNSSVTNCYYLDTCVTNGKTVTGATALTAQQMTDDANWKTNYAGFDTTTPVWSKQNNEGTKKYLPKLDSYSPTLHVHNWTYSADGSTITATCNVDGCTNTAGGSVTISAPTDLSYSNSSKDAACSYSNWLPDEEETIVYNTVDRINVTGKDITASITIGGATASVSYQITPRKITTSMVTLSPSSPTYDGSEKTVTVTVKYSSTTLTAGTDYEITGTTSATEPSTGSGYAVTVTGKGNYTGEVTRYWKIKKIPLSPTIAIEGWTYGDSPKAPSVTENPENGEVTYTYYISIERRAVKTGEANGADAEGGVPKYAGTYYVGASIAETEHYQQKTISPSANTEFIISPREVTDPTFEGLQATYPYDNGNEIKPAFTLKDDLGNVIPESEYTVIYSNNTAAGVATITIHDITGGNYTVSGSTTFKIITHSHSWKYTASGTTITATCKADGCSNTDGGSVTLKVENAYYTGSAIGATVEGSFTNGATYKVTYNDSETVPSSIGTHTAMLTVYENGTEKQSVTAQYKISYLDAPKPAYTISGAYEDNGTYWFKTGASVTVNAPDGYTVSTVLNDTYGSSVSFSESDSKIIYLKRTTDGALTDAISVEGIRFDGNGATGKITIETRGFWEKLFNKITFGLFFKGDAVAKVSATDVDSGWKSIQYYVADEDLINENDASALEAAIGNKWNDYSNEITLNKNAKNVIYVKITDNVGNVTYLSSEGIVLYSDAEADTESVSTTYKAGADKDVSVKLNGNTVKEIKNGTTVLTAGTDYSVSAVGIITLKADYLDTLSAGTYTFTVSYNPLGETYVEAASNDAPATTTFTVVVEKAAGKVSNIIITGKTYDGTAVTAPTFDKLGDGVATIEYKVKGADDSTYTTTAPKNTGDYVVRVTVAEGTNHKAASATADFTIDKVAITVTADAKSKTYGEGDPALTWSITSGALVNGEQLTGITISRVSGENANIYAITVSQPDGANKNYDITFVDETFTINAKTVDATVVVNGAPFTYNGSKYEPEIVVKDGDTVIPANEYEVGYANNINAGTATVTVTDKDGGNYVVNGTEIFIINKADPVIGTVGVDGVVKDSTKPSDVVLTRTNSIVDGVLTLADNAMLANKSTYRWVFTPTDTDNYNVINGDVQIDVLDTVLPTAVIKVDTNEWKQFINNITFGLFFKETQEVTITAADNENGSGIKDVLYFVSDKGLGENDLATVEWKVYTEAFDIEPDGKYVIYAKVTDNDGNTVVINSDGVVVDETAAVVSGITDGETYYGQLVFTVTDELAGVKSVVIDGVDKTHFEGQYLINGDNAEHKVVVTDNAGNVTEYKVTVNKNYTVTYKADGESISTETVGHGKDANLPSVPAKDGYVGKWDGDGKNITGDTTITVVYTEIPVVKPDEVKPEDKTDLEDTKAKLEEELKDDSYTDDDKKDIQDAIDNIDDALEVIGNVEAVEELIDKLPDTIKKDDEPAIKAADDAYNALTDYEKSLVDDDVKKALDDAKAALAELNKPADTDSPQTGDNSNMFLWIALLFISGGAVITLTVVDRKRRTASKR